MPLYHYNHLIMDYESYKLSPYTSTLAISSLTPNLLTRYVYSISYVLDTMYLPKRRDARRSELRDLLQVT